MQRVNNRGTECEENFIGYIVDDKTVIHTFADVQKFLQKIEAENKKVKHEITVNGEEKKYNEASTIVQKAFTKFVAGNSNVKYSFSTEKLSYSDLSTLMEKRDGTVDFAEMNDADGFRKQNCKTFNVIRRL